MGKELEKLLDENRKLMLEAALPKAMTEDMLNIITIAENDFIGVTVSTVYQFAPMYKPRKIDKIVEHIHDWFEKNRINKHFKPLIVIKNNLEEITKKVEEILLSCEEFKELNLSQREYEKGIAVNNKNRRNLFTGIGYKIDPLDDFIDLEACISSIAHKLKEEME